MGVSSVRLILTAFLLVVMRDARAEEAEGGEVGDAHEFSIEEMDKDGDGLLTLEEIKQFVLDDSENEREKEDFEQKHLPLIKKIFAKMFAEADTDGDGKIDAEGLKKLKDAFLLVVMRDARAEEAGGGEVGDAHEFSIKEMDKDGGGLLTLEEIKQFEYDDSENEREDFEQKPLPLIKKIFAEADTDGDGKI